MQWLPTLFTFLWVSSLLDDVGTYLIPPEKIRKHFPEGGTKRELKASETYNVFKAI